MVGFSRGKPLGSVPHVTDQYETRRRDEPAASRCTVLHPHVQVTVQKGDTVRWLLVDPVSLGGQAYHNPYFTNQVRRA